ncbi:N-acetylmuramic acid 6-phosphate etherase [Staphylococcus casei]|uniref:N-acetylmuramic acid 6-phosphate etherase n=1 Tax=Staphylococcus casei TaxID=201828 RepID=A0ABZ2W9I6_9STAP|nr:N-acetylmuramic acid 6-phosphate etherase [Staphylococcus succinus]
MNHLITESRNENTMQLDEMTIHQALETMNNEDQKVPQQIKQVLPELTRVIEITTHQFKNGGRIIYMGAGTSGRLGVLDAAECVPTFNTTPNDFIGLIAGGQRAMTVAVEGAEDSQTLAETDLSHINLTDKDVVIGLAASGSTPYVKAGLTYANELGSHTVAISCNVGSEIGKIAQIPIEVNVGPEVLTGSTRLKSGTAQKLILNMISTITMVGVGKVYGNLMVDVKASNDKLIDRSIRIIQDICDMPYEAAQELYTDADKNIKTAVVMYLCDISKIEAETKLRQNDYIIKQAIKD